MASNSGYVNPIGAGLTPERIDQGVDYGGTGNLYALGSGVITNLNPNGWPGNAYIGLRLSSGPDAGDYVYYAEDINPSVSVGQQVTAGQIIGQATGGPSGIEVGWSAAPGTGETMAALTRQNALGLSQGDPGKYSTGYGVSFSNLIQSLGGKAGILDPPVQGAVPTNLAPPGTVPSTPGGSIDLTSAAGGPFPGGEFDPFNWVWSIFGGATKAGTQGIQDLINSALQFLGGIVKKSYADAWQRFKPDLIRIGLILLGVMVLYAGIQGFLRPNASPSDIIVKSGKSASSKEK